MNTRIILVWMLLVSVFSFGQDHMNGLDGFYVGNGDDASSNLIASVGAGSIEFLFLWPTEADSVKETLFELALCEMKHSCGQLYEINCIEPPEQDLYCRKDVGSKCL